MSNESEGNVGQTLLQLEWERDPLDSWKEIATYLNRNVRTVQRWEKREGLPIHRHVHERASSVSACKKEIDAWQKQRSRVSNEIPENQRGAGIRDRVAQNEASGETYARGIRHCPTQR
jgi:uncharacterized protein YjcR